MTCAGANKGSLVSQPAVRPVPGTWYSLGKQAAQGLPKEISGNLPLAPWALASPMACHVDWGLHLSGAANREAYASLPLKGSNLADLRQGRIFKVALQKTVVRTTSRLR